MMTQRRPLEADDTIYRTQARVYTGQSTYGVEVEPRTSGCEEAYGPYSPPPWSQAPESRMENNLEFICLYT
jgi:hypothetical protein